MQLSAYLAGFLLVAQYATCSPVTESLHLLGFLHRAFSSRVPTDTASNDEVSENKPVSSEKVDCRQDYKTDVWTGCDDVLAQFQLTLEQFILANPSIGDECDGFVPGKTYCVAFRLPRNVTEDGACGQKINFSKTCVGSDFGDCCGLDGKCGSGEEFCGDNCQDGSCSGATETTSSTTAKPSATQALSVSTNGDCAYNSGFTCKGSKFGDCCSAAGYCGDDEYHCDKYLDCQPDFGKCT